MRALLPPVAVGRVGVADRPDAAVVARATTRVTDLVVPPDYEDHAFVRVLVEAIDHFKGTGKSPSERAKKEVKQYFLDLGRLPDGTEITAHMAEKLATFCRSPQAMKGGNKRG